MEEESRLSSQESGRDGDDETQDPLLGETQEQDVRQAGSRSESQMRGLEPDDCAGNAAELRGVKHLSLSTTLPAHPICATTPSSRLAAYLLPREMYD